MPTERSWTVQCLNDIVERVDFVHRALDGVSFEAFVDDPTLDAAVHHHLMIVGEAARRLGSDLERLLPGHDWPAIKRFGNVIRHDYDDVKPEIAFGLFADGELDRLRADCRQAIDRVMHKRS